MPTKQRSKNAQAKVNPLVINAAIARASKGLKKKWVENGELVPAGARNAAVARTGKKIRAEMERQAAEKMSAMRTKHAASLQAAQAEATGLQGENAALRQNADRLQARVDSLEAFREKTIHALEEVRSLLRLLKPLTADNVASIREVWELQALVAIDAKGASDHERATTRILLEDAREALEAVAEFVAERHNYSGQAATSIPNYGPILSA
jgi:hypothetical protein